MKFLNLLFTSLTLVWAAATAVSPKGHCKIVRPCVDDLHGVSYIDHVYATRVRSSGRTYRFVHIRNKPKKPYLLFLHGFPESAYDWRRQIEYFGRKGYGVIAPDLLGYGGTDKPVDLNAYRLKQIATEVVDILDCLGIKTVEAVGHDFGSPLLSRMVNYFPSRATSLTFMDIGYAPPPISFNKAGIDSFNNLTLTTLGYEGFGYWSFFNEENSGRILNAHEDSLWSLVYTDTPDIWKTAFGPTSSLKKFLLANRMAPWGKFLTRKERAVHNSIFDPARGGYEAPLRWYKSVYRDYNKADEASIPPDAVQLQVPVLVIGAGKDPIGLPSFAEQSTKPYAKDYQFAEVEAGHFVMLEQASKVNEILTGFFEKLSK